MYMPVRYNTRGYDNPERNDSKGPENNKKGTLTYSSFL